MDAVILEIRRRNIEMAEARRAAAQVEAVCVEETPNA
jgi:hypothetical protein